MRDGLQRDNFQSVCWPQVLFLGFQCCWVRLGEGAGQGSGFDLVILFTARAAVIALAAGKLLNSSRLQKRFMTRHTLKKESAFLFMNHCLGD